MIFTGQVRAMALAVVGAALVALVAYQTERIFEPDYEAWFAAATPLVALAIGLLLYRRQWFLRAPAQVIGVLAVTAFAISRNGGTPSEDLAGALLRGLSANLSTRWPAPVLAETLGGVIAAIAIAAAVTVELALARRFAVAVLMPSVLLMIIVALLAAPAGPPSGQVLVAYIVLALLALRLAALTRSDLPHHARGAQRDVERRSRVSMAIVGTTTLVVGLVPAAFGELVQDSVRFDPRDRLADEVTAEDEISPLARLDEWRNREPPNEVFTTTSDIEDRWRLAALTRYDGRTWLPADDYRLSGGTIEPGTDGAESERVDVTVGDLDARWLPAPNGTLEVSRPVFVDGTTGSLLVDAPPEIGDTYSLDVEDYVEPTAPVLAGAAAGTPLNTFVDGFTLPTEISELASTIVTGATTPYERAQRIASYLQERYRLVSDVPAGHSLTVLEQFLLGSKTGRDEQFVAAYGLLAASIGLPVRISVGFDTIPDPSGSGRVARSDLVRAWPEVEFEDFGWVRFDPIPGRETTESTTGEEAVAPVNDQQDQVPPTTAATPATSTPSDVSPPEALDTGFEVPTGVRRATVGFAAVLLLIASYVIIVLRLKTVRRMRRRQSTDPERRATGAFRSGVDVLIDLGATAPTSKTDRELVASGVGMFGDSASELSPVAEIATQAVYDQPEPDDEMAGDAWDALGAFERETAQELGRWRYLRAKLSLRSFRRGLPD